MLSFISCDGENVSIDVFKIEAYFILKAIFNDMMIW